MENKAHALAAGIFTILLGISAAVAVWWLGQSDESTTIYVLETKRNVTGLNIQAQVRYRGIRAGKVLSIEPDGKDPRNLLIEISVDSRYKLTRGSTAQLGYQGVTGLAYVLIEDDGSSAEPLVGKDGTPARIAMKATLLDTVGEKAGAIVDSISAVAVRLDKLLDDRNLKNITRTLDNVAAASEGMRDLPAVVASARELLSERNQRSLRQILAHVEKTAGEGAPLAVEMRELVTSMNALAKRFDQVAAGAGNELTSGTLPRANALIEELSANSRQLSRLLDGLESNPQMLLFGGNAPAPGPGETGFAAPNPKGDGK